MRVERLDALLGDPGRAVRWLDQLSNGHANSGPREQSVAGRNSDTSSNGQPAGLSSPSPHVDASDPSETNLPRIVRRDDDPKEGLKKWSPAGLDALAKSNEGLTACIFQRGGALGRLRKSLDGGPPYFEPFRRDSLRGALDRAAAWGKTQRTRKGGNKTKWVAAPLDVTRDILSLPDYDPVRFPILDIVVQSPRFLPNGSLALAPGYHAAGRIWYAPTTDLDGISISLNPTDAEVEDAKRLILDELLVDFTFVDAFSRANALSFTLLPFVRLLIDGPTPNHHFSASTEGTGKGLCVAACSFPDLGHEVYLTSQKENDAEWRKALTANFMSGQSHLVIDNLSNLASSWNRSYHPVDSGALAMAWTVRNWRDRILGKSEEVDVRVQTIFASTGNNVLFSRELERRIVSIELQSTVENPSLREGFKHHPLIAWTRRIGVRWSRRA